MYYRYNFTILSHWDDTFFTSQRIRTGLDYFQSWIIYVKKLWYGVSPIKDRDIVIFCMFRYRIMQLWPRWRQPLGVGPAWI